MIGSIWIDSVDPEATGRRFKVRGLTSGGYIEFVHAWGRDIHGIERAPGAAAAEAESAGPPPDGELPYVLSPATSRVLLSGGLEAWEGVTREGAPLPCTAANALEHLVIDDVQAICDEVWRRTRVPRDVLAKK